MIIDIHGHYTTTPPQVSEFRQRQIEQFQRDGTVSQEPPPVSEAESKYINIVF